MELLEKIDKFKKEIEDAVGKYLLPDKLVYQIKNWIDIYTNCIDLQKKKALLSKVVREVVICKRFL